MPSEEVSFDSDVFLVLKERAKSLKSAPKPSTSPGKPPVVKPGESGAETTTTPEPPVAVESGAATRTLRVNGYVPSELWNRLGNRLLPKLRSNPTLKLKVDFTLDIAADEVGRLEAELRQALSDLGLKDAVQVEIR